MGILQTKQKNNNKKFIKICLKNKKVQILESVTCWPLSNDFILVTARDGGNQSTYYHKFSAQSI